MIRLTAGLGALILLVAMLGRYRQLHDSPSAIVLIWGTTFVATVLLVWRERNHAVANRKGAEEHARFIAAAETSPDAFFILDSVRNRAGDIVDFRYVYVNSHAEDLLNTPRETLLKQDM